MEAEFTGFTDKHGNATLPSDVTFSDWLKQTYLSSGSLLAKSCQSAMKLASHSSDVQQQAYKYGLNTAYVQQVSLHCTRCVCREVGEVNWCFMLS